jgi:hypothetical protein
LFHVPPLNRTLHLECVFSEEGIIFLTFIDFPA